MMSVQVEEPVIYAMDGRERMVNRLISADERSRSVERNFIS